MTKNKITDKCNYCNSCLNCLLVHAKYSLEESLDEAEKLFNRFLEINATKSDVLVCHSIMVYGAREGHQKIKEIKEKLKVFNNILNSFRLN